MSKMIDSRPALAATAVLLALLVLPAPSFAQRPGDQQVNWRAADAVTERAGGEVAVHSSTLLLSDRGRAYSATLSFASQDDYLKALALGGRGINLANLDDAWYADGFGTFKVVSKPGDRGIFNLAENARGTICGDIVVRGTTKIGDGITVGVSVHAVKAGDFVHDIHGACDFFAAGGCGSDPCYNSLQTTTGVIIGKGDCRELEVFGPNTCYCHTTSIIHSS